VKSRRASGTRVIINAGVIVARQPWGEVGSQGRDSTIAIVESGFQCAGCGEWNETLVDESAGHRQSYVEDCQVCCRPNVLRVEYDLELEQYLIGAELE
jgi:hypothetical protein